MAGFVKKAAQAAQTTMNKSASKEAAVVPELKVKVEDEILLIPPQMVHPDLNQPRKERDPVEFLKVKNSIKQTKGNTQPITVRKHPTIKGEYMIVMGEGRWESCLEFDFPVRAILKRDYDEERAEANPNVEFDKLFAQLSENVGRNDLSIVRQAEGLANLVQLHTDNLPEKVIGEMLGYNKSQTSRLMKLSSAPDEVKQLSIDGVSQNINFLLLLIDLQALVDADTFEEYLKEARDKNLFERGLRQIVKELKEPKQLKEPEHSPENGATVESGAPSLESQENGVSSKEEEQLSLPNDEPQEEKPIETDFSLILKALENKGCNKKQVEKILSNVEQAQDDGYTINESAVAEHIDSLTGKSVIEFAKYDALVDDCLSLYETPTDIRPPAAPEDIGLFPVMESCEVVDGFLLIYIKGYKLPLKVCKSEAKQELLTAIQQM